MWIFLLLNEVVQFPTAEYVFNIADASGMQDEYHMNSVAVRLLLPGSSRQSLNSQNMY